MYAQKNLTSYNPQ